MTNQVLTQSKHLHFHVQLIEAERRIYVSMNWVIVGSDNGLSPIRRQAIFCTNAEILLIGPSETKFSEIFIGIQTFSLMKWHLKTSSVKWSLFCLGLNGLMPKSKTYRWSPKCCIMLTSWMKHFSRYWPLVRGIHRSPVNSPHKTEWRGALMFLWSAPWINGRVSNREAGDLTRHRAHYDVIVMMSE